MGFKPTRMRRMKCIPVGDWIECSKIKCEDCDYLECNHKQTDSLLTIYFK
jgi:hypothetical protein